MASGVKFHAYVEDEAEGKHALDSDVLKLALTNTLPDASSDSQFADISEIAAGNGYTAGGEAMTLVSSEQTAGTYKLIVNDVTWTASGGSIGPFRYAVLYNSTEAGAPLIAYWDRGSSITLGDTDTFTADASAVNGILQKT